MSETDNLSCNLKKLQKDQNECKASQWKEIIKTRAEHNKIGRRKIRDKINETKNLVFGSINKTDKPLARLTKKKKENIQISKTRNEREDSTMALTED